MQTTVHDGTRLGLHQGQWGAAAWRGGGRDCGTAHRLHVRRAGAGALASPTNMAFEAVP
jgi:hypothetical protein